MPEEWSGTIRLLQSARGHEMKLDRLANHLYNEGVLAPEIYHAPEILAYDLQRFGGASGHRVPDAGRGPRLRRRRTASVVELRGNGRDGVAG